MKKTIIKMRTISLTLAFIHVTWKSIEIIHSPSGAKSVPNIGCHKLLRTQNLLCRLINRQTDRQADWLTDTFKIICPLSYPKRDISILFWYISLSVAILTIHDIKELGPGTAKLVLLICLKMKMIECVEKSVIQQMNPCWFHVCGYDVIFWRVLALWRHE